MLRFVEEGETKRSRFLRNSNRFVPFITIYFCFVSTLFYIISGYKLPILIVFVFDLFTQGKFAVYGIKGSKYWIVARCILKLFAYPV